MDPSKFKSILKNYHNSLQTHSTLPVFLGLLVLSLVANSFITRISSYYALATITTNSASSVSSTLEDVLKGYSLFAKFITSGTLLLDILYSIGLVGCLSIALNTSFKDDHPTNTSSSPAVMIMTLAPISILTITIPQSILLSLSILLSIAAPSTSVMVFNTTQNVLPPLRLVLLALNAALLGLRLPKLMTHIWMNIGVDDRQKVQPSSQIKKKE